MVDKPLIQLWQSRSLGLIVRHPSGVRYTNQTGGYACLHPEIEGVYVPLADAYSEQVSRLAEHFVTRWGGHCYDGIDAETADFIEQVLRTSWVAENLQVDRTRLEDSHEAWIYVRVPGSADSGNPRLQPFSGFLDAEGVLTWENSD